MKPTEKKIKKLFSQGVCFDCLSLCFDLKLKEVEEMIRKKVIK